MHYSESTLYLRVVEVTRKHDMLDTLIEKHGSNESTFVRVISVDKEYNRNHIYICREADIIMVECKDKYVLKSNILAYIENATNDYVDKDTKTYKKGYYDRGGMPRIEKFC